ncbi:MAG TPA: type III pantothenate kinase [Pyrinomonadaceae bacterium]
MLLAVDIGNSSIKFGVFEQDTFTTKFSIPTDREYTAEDIAGHVGDRLPNVVDAAIVCSVVPEVDRAVNEYIENSFHVKPRFVLSTDDLGLKINFNVETTGTDRLVNSFAAAEKYGKPCIVVSLGTATTIDVVNREGEYLGGLIAPGMKVSARALSLAASMLPEVELRKPEHVIAKTTASAIQSGIVYGQIAMVSGLLERIIRELGFKPTIIATGGFANLIANEIDLIDTVDPDLTLEGLNRLARDQ